MKTQEQTEKAGPEEIWAVQFPGENPPTPVCKPYQVPDSFRPGQVLTKQHQEIYFSITLSDGTVRCLRCGHILASQFKLGPGKSSKRRANEWWSKVTGR